MKTDRFKVADTIRKLIVALEDLLVNYPKKYYDQKRRTLDYAYESLRLCYRANVCHNEEDKISTMEEALSYLTMIDYILNFSLDQKLITKKKYEKFARSLEDVNKFANGWIKAIKNKTVEINATRANYASSKLRNVAN